MKRNPHGFKETLVREILRDKRLENNLRQKDIAEILDSPQQFVSKYENGERLLTFAETIKICKALNFSPEHFLKRYLQSYKEGLKEEAE